MPVKNTEKYLPECIESIINQTEINWELIAVDDGSTDNSFEILYDYSSQDSRIKVFKNTGKGIIDALNLAYSKSAGEYITRMDSDDIMQPLKLELLLNKLNEKGRGYLATGCVKYFSENELGDGFLKYEKWLNQLTKKDSNFTEIYKECVIPSPCWMISRADFDACGAFNSVVYPEDYELVFRFYEKSLKVIGVNKEIHFWRDYQTRTSRTDDNYKDNRFIELKISKFVELDYDASKELIVWGAGKKGKKIAQYLSNKKIDFRWFCNNSKKIGKEIYGVIMENSEELTPNSNYQIILAVAGDEQVKVLNKIQNFQYFLFC